MRLRLPAMIACLAMGAIFVACDSATSSTTSGPTAKDTATVGGPTTTKIPDTTTKPVDTTTKPKAGAELVGRWSDHEFEDKDEYWDTLTLRADGSFTGTSVYKLVGPPPEAGSMSYSGTWSVAGNQMAMVVGGKTFTATYRIVGSLLIQESADRLEPDTMVRVP